MKTLFTAFIILSLSAAGNHLFVHHNERMKALSNESLHWPSVTGLVTYSGLESRQRKISSQRQMDYRMEISYEYIVDDERFENDVVRFNQRNLSRPEKELLVSTHPKGRQVKVFYNPEKPQQSVLVRGSWQ